MLIVTILPTMSIANIAKVFGAVFVLIGVLGYVPGITSNGMLLGIFEVDMVHNIIHILTGLLALAAAFSSEKYAKLFFQVFGVVYALVAVLGFIQGDMVLGLFHVNAADNYLHVVVAVVALYAGFVMKSGGGSQMPPRQNNTPDMPGMQN